VKKRRILKVLLSLFVVYHIAAVLLMPNPDSFLTQEIGFLFRGYASTLGLNTPWRFFSPEPSSHVYFEYDLMPEGAEGGAHRWPPASRRGYLADNYMRLIYNSRFVTSSPERIEKFLIPWLCRLHPGTEEVSLRTLSEELVSLQKARLIGGPLEKLYDVKTWSQVPYACGGAHE
jgi:hypothetical protein